MDVQPKIHTPKHEPMFDSYSFILSLIRIIIIYAFLQWSSLDVTFKGHLISTLSDWLMIGCLQCTSGVIVVFLTAREGSTVGSRLKGAWLESHLWDVITVGLMFTWKTWRRSWDSSNKETAPSHVPRSLAANSQRSRTRDTLPSSWPFFVTSYEAVSVLF